MKMSRDELEYAISQYLDGVLPPLERASLEERLAGDVEAREILAEYQKLDGVLKTSMPVPDIAWDDFGADMRQLLANEPTPVQHFRLPVMGWTQRLAIAAGLLFALSVGLYFLRPQPQNPVATNPIPETAKAIVVVTNPTLAPTASPIVQDVKIGPAPNLTNQFRAPEEVIVRPTIVQIDRGNSSGQDSDLY